MERIGAGNTAHPPRPGHADEAAGSPSEDSAVAPDRRPVSPTDVPAQRCPGWQPRQESHASGVLLGLSEYTCCISPQSLHGDHRAVEALPAVSVRTCVLADGCDISPGDSGPVPFSHQFLVKALSGGSSAV